MCPSPEHFLLKPCVKRQETGKERGTEVPTTGWRRGHHRSWETAYASYLNMHGLIILAGKIRRLDQ